MALGSFDEICGIVFQLEPGATTQANNMTVSMVLCEFSNALPCTIQSGEQFILLPQQRLKDGNHLVRFVPVTRLHIFRQIGVAGVHLELPAVIECPWHF